MTRKVSSAAELRQRVLEMMARGEDPAGTVWEVPAEFFKEGQGPGYVGMDFAAGYGWASVPEITLPSGKKAQLNGNEIIIPE